MMESILIFSLKSMLCSGLFMAYYLLALKNVQMHSFNRIYLIMAALLSLLLPFTKFEFFSVVPVTVPDIPLLAISGKGVQEVVTNTAATSKMFNWEMVLVGLYFVVALLIIVQLILRSISVYSLKRKGQQVKQAGFLLIKTDDPRAPFSFMNMLFWPTHMRQDSPEGKGIFMHELTHISQYHTLDKIFMQLMIAVCWLNPFNWLIKKEVWLQHEFLADKDAIADRDSETFARMLLYSVTNVSNKSVISPFFQSHIHRRVLMLARSGNSRYGFMRRILSIPVLLTAVLLLSADTDKPAMVSPSPDRIVLVLDPAHGGEDVGGKSANGYQEKDFTLAICKKLESLCGEYNISIITTRNGDVHQSLQERVKLSNSTDDAIFLSVHVNQSSALRDNAYQLGVNPKSSNYNKSVLLASAIAGKLKDQKLPVEVVDHSMAYILRENKRPALLIECGNLDDEANIALLKNEARTEMLCRNILSGIVDYNAKFATK